MSFKRFINFLLFILASFVLIIPNSFQIITAGLLTVVNLFIFLEYKKIIANGYFVFCWILLSSVFIFFIIISGIIPQFKFELILKYVFFPFLWLNIFTYIKQNFKLESFTKILFHFSFVSLFVVIILYVLMLNGYNYVQYFFDDPNINSDYYLGFTLDVYGNLIFFAAGFFILPDIYKTKIVAFLYIIVFILVVFISARTALMVSFAIGFLFLFFRELYRKKYSTPLIYLLLLIAFIFALGYYTEKNLNYNLYDYLQKGSIGKLKGLGGEDRTSQTTIMMDRILENPWGIGFGNIGIERNAEKSFKYEVLILATVLRFGILGFTLIGMSLSPVLKGTIRFFKLSMYKKFYLAGFFAIIVFSFTNPYLESFDFQWMFFCPLVFLSDFSNETFRWRKMLRN